MTFCNLQYKANRGPLLRCIKIERVVYLMRIVHRLSTDFVALFSHDTIFRENILSFLANVKTVIRMLEETSQQIKVER